MSWRLPMQRTHHHHIKWSILYRKEFRLWWNSTLHYRRRRNRMRWILVFSLNFDKFRFFSFNIKGALDILSLIPQSWDFYTIRSVYLYMKRIHAQSYLQLQHSYKDSWFFFFQWPFFKVDFLTCPPPHVMTVDDLAPLTIIIVPVWRKILKRFCAVLWIDTKINWTLCKLW